MELTKISMPTPNDDPLLPDHHSSSTRRKKRQFIAVLVLCFTLILAAIISVLAVLKHQIESESPARNPAVATLSVCSPSGYTDGYCFTILSPLRDSSQPVNPNQIFTLAVRSAIDAISGLTSLPESTDPETDSTLRSCEVAFNETLSRLAAASTTLGVDVGNLTAWFSTESFNKVKTCLHWLEWPTVTVIDSFRTEKTYWRESTRYARSSLTILGRANMISETFNPTIKSTLASFLAGWNSAFTVCVFGVQYLYLVVLFCILLRLY